MDPQGDAGEQEHLPHLIELLIGQAPGVVVRPGHGGGDAQQRAHPGPLVPVAVREDQLLLAQIAVLLKDFPQIAHTCSSPSGGPSALPVRHSKKVYHDFPFFTSAGS
ncbi:Uncharacterised protein [uncultured Blautia sp.]|nr:Uncharacterised protein [uncultured Blautia sp.]